MTYTPDWNMVNKIQLYDKDLFVKWNNKKSWFELWRKQAVGATLITPVTQSIYDSNAPIKYTPLDERLLRWIYFADSHKLDNVHQFLQEKDDRFKLKTLEEMKKFRRDCRDKAKDMWQHVNNKFVKTYAKKNGPPKFNSKSKSVRWVRPDSKGTTTGRVWGRSGANARQYFGD